MSVDLLEDRLQEDFALPPSNERSRGLEAVFVVQIEQQVLLSIIPKSIETICYILIAHVYIYMYKSPTQHK